MNFYEKVYHFTQKIPRGKVATYSQVASLISTPRAARQVGQALSKLPQNTNIPWHRVVSAKGFVSIENLAVSKKEQVERLQSEGIAVEFREGNWRVDLEKYLWKPYKSLKKSKNRAIFYL